jgi:hypothetical protein
MVWTVVQKAVRANEAAPPSVAFYKSGISFTRKAGEMLGGRAFVEFLIDEGTRKLAIRPMDTATVNSYSVGVTGTKAPQLKVNVSRLVSRLRLPELPWRGELIRQGDGLLVVQLPPTSKQEVSG